MQICSADTFKSHPSQLHMVYHPAQEQAADSAMGLVMEKKKKVEPVSAVKKEREKKRMAT